MKKQLKITLRGNFKLKWLSFIFPPLCILCILLLIIFSYLYLEYEKSDTIFHKIARLRINFSKIALRETFLLAGQQNLEDLSEQYKKIENKCFSCHKFQESPLKKKREIIIKINEILKEKEKIIKQTILLLGEANYLTKEIINIHLVSIAQKRELNNLTFKKLLLIQEIREDFQKIFNISLKTKDKKQIEIFRQKIEEIKQKLTKFEEISSDPQDGIFIEEILAKIFRIKIYINNLIKIEKNYIKILEENSEENEKFLTILAKAENSLAEKTQKLRALMGGVFALLSLSSMLTIGTSSLLLRKLLADLNEIYNNTQKMNKNLSERINYKPFFFEIKELKNTLNKFANELYEHIVRLQVLLVETKELSNELNKFALAVSQSPVGIALADKEGKIQYVNQAYENITGYKLQEVYGRKDKIFENLPQNNTHKKLEKIFYLTKKDKSGVWIKTIITPIKDEEDQINNWLAIIEDITTEKLLEEKKDLLSRIEILALTAGGLAHDFNNLLAAQLGYLEMALIKPEKWENYIKKARNICLKGKEFTTRLLAITKGKPQQREKVSIPAIIQEAAELCLKGTSCELIMDFAPGLACILGDRHQILQVFQNLFLNAVEAMKEKGRITVKAETIEIKDKDELSPGMYVYITVEDEGPGIPPELREKVFHPFFSTKERGTGLGLATVYSVIKNHGGTIKIKEGTKGGALFEIFLPAKEKKKTKQTKEQTQRKLRCAEFSGKVLVLEDEAPLRESLREMLEVLGFDVEEAENGEMALEIFKKAQQKQEHFDIIITDFYFNGKLNGENFIKEVKKLSKKLRIIVTSGKPLEFSLQEELGIAAFLRKPFSFRDLHQTIARILKQDL